MVEGIVKGNVTILSQAVTLIESVNPQHQAKAQEVIEKCLPYSGNSVRIGISGVPGAGKSTSIDEFGTYVLNTYGVKATFFITTDELAGREDRVLRLYESGMEIANHTQNHPHFDRISTEAALREIAECDRALEAITGQRPALIRAPFGTLPARVALQEDRWFVHWSLDTIDWKFIKTRYIYNRIVGEVKDKDIILMHQSLPETTEAVRRAIPVLIERGYRFVTCSELIELCDGVSTQAKVHRFVAN